MRLAAGGARRCYSEEAMRKRLFPSFRHGLRLAALLAAACAPACAEPDPDWEAQREAMVQEIRADVRKTSGYTGTPTLDAAVIEALRTVPRHEFVPQPYREFAYLNRPLPIGEDQTISQPYIVALMTDLAGVGPGSRVLEIGTGSGYQAAVLAEIAEHVYTIEIIDPLGRQARTTLARLGYDNVSVRIGDGYAGWPEHAPFDAVIVTAAPETVPVPLVDQLAVGGRLVVPVGPQFESQVLRVIEKDANGALSSRDILPVRFVPFTRD